MKLTSILVLPSFMPIVVFASLSSAPTATPMALSIPTATVSASSNSFLLRNTSKSVDLGEETQPTRTSGEDAPVITAAPTAEEIQLQEKYHLTTYWSCVTLQTYTHCGWHEPLMAGGTEIAGASCGSCHAGRVAMVAAGVAMAAGIVL